MKKNILSEAFRATLTRFKQKEHKLPKPSALSHTKLVFEDYECKHFHGTFKRLNKVSRTIASTHI